jgi:hypothetical protein
MKLRTLFFGALMLALGLAKVSAQDDSATPPADVPVISTTPSQNYAEVTCTTSDPAACDDALQLATDTRDTLGPLLNLGPKWRFPVHIHIMTPDDPLLAKINRNASAVFAQGNTMKIEAVVPSTDPEAREFMQRQFVTAILWEKFFANTKTFDKSTRLDVVPMWLVEGLREWLNDDPERNRESLVRRAVQNQMAPTLAEITSWRELSKDRLLGLWQRAFSYYLVDCLTRQGARRDDFQQWLSGFSDPTPTAQLHFPTEVDWEQELVEATARSHDIVYTWDETASEFASTETITFAASKDAKVQTCTLDTVASLPRSPALVEALQEQVFALTGLELRAHPSWHTILELYRTGLTALVKNTDPAQAKQLLQEAQHQRLVAVDYHQKMLDYVNWFEVTKDYQENDSPFRSYFTTAKEMEQVQADPAHPNPVRANLLQIESEL